jgi:hypothetical protein
MHNPVSNLPTEREQLRDMLATSDARATTRRQHKPSQRAQRVWDRLGDWYGARFADQFGDLPTQDWCTVIDNVSNDDLVAVLVLVRERHVTFPPTLPELVALVKEVRLPRLHAPSIPEQLTDFVTRAYALSSTQLRGPWTFLYRLAGGHPVVIGLIIDADGDKPGYRVTVEDMQMYSHRP